MVYFLVIVKVSSKAHKRQADYKIYILGKNVYIFILKKLQKTNKKLLITLIHLFHNKTKLSDNSKINLR